MSIKHFNQQTQKWDKVSSLLASSITVTDINGKYDSQSVEGCLQEIASALDDRFDDVEFTSNGMLNFYSNGVVIKEVLVPIMRNGNVNPELINKINKRLDDLEQRVSWLEENGGGGSNGNTPPTITSTFSKTSFSTDDEIEIPYFLMDNQGGNFKANYIIDGETIEEQAVLGPNVWKVGKLSKGKHMLKIYIKDFSLFSNELIFNITVGSLEITSTFRDKDYGLNENITVNYDIESINSDAIKVEREIDGSLEEVDARPGRNTWALGVLNKGVHNIKLKAKTEEAESNVLSYTFTVTDAESLYISTTFDNETWNVEDRLIIPYRISLLGGSKFKVKYKINGVQQPTADASLGMNFWDLGYMDIGDYELEIEATNVSGTMISNKLLINLTVAATDFTPTRPVEDYLLCWFDAKGKSNSYDDREEWIDKSGNGVKATLHKVNFSNNGWINDGLRLTGDAYCEIDVQPFLGGVSNYGLTIDVQFDFNHSGNDDARIFSCEMPIVPYAGASVSADNLGILGTESINQSPNNEKNLIRATFVVDPDIQRSYIFVNGVICNTALLSSSDFFGHDGKIYLNAQKDKEGNIVNLADCTIYNLRVYDKALTAEEVVQNHIADMTIEAQKEAVRRNTFSFLGQMDFDGSFAGMGADDQVPMRVAFSPNDGPGQKFDFPAVMVDWQGNSSLQYAIKNYNIDLFDEQGEAVDIQMHPDWPAHDSYHIKANMVDSSHAFNVGIAKLLPKIYTEPIPPMLEDPEGKTRYAVDGFPITVFHNGKLHGLYTFNLKQHRKIFGMDKKNPGHFMYRAEENSAMGAAAFRDSSDWSIEQEFEERHPKRPPGTGVKHNEFRRLINFVKDSSDATFVKDLTKYFNKNYLLDYYIICYVFGGIDSLGKNMTLMTWDATSTSGIWYTMFYDMDTFFGFDNKGELVWGPDVRCPEDYNTSGSLLWERVGKLLAKDIRDRYSVLRRGGLTLENTLETLQGEVIDNIGESFYNMDATDKYLSQGAAYLYMAKGNRVQHLRRWLTARFLYVDSMFGYLPDVENSIILRNTMSGTWTLRIKTYTPQQITVEFGGTGVGGDADKQGIQTKLCNNKEWTEFTYTFDGVYQRDISITGAKYIMGLEGLENCELLMLDVRYCEKLKEIKARNNPNLTSLNLSNCIRLEYLDVSGCTRLGTTTGTPLDVGNCYNLKHLDISNTGVPAITTTSCSYLTYVDISNSLISSINYSHLQSLSTVNISRCSRLTNITIDSCQGITALNITDNPALREIRIENCKELKTLNLNNVRDLEKLDISECPKLTNIKIRNADVLRYIDLGGCAGLEIFDAQGVQLEEILFGTIENLKTLDISQNIRIRELDFGECQSTLESFKIKENLNLRKVKNINLLINNYEQVKTFSGNDYIQSITGRISFADEITSARDMFKNCIDLEELPEFDFNNVTVLSGMLQGCSTLREVPNWDTSNIVDLSYMFFDCINLETAPNFNTAKVRDFNYMFYNCITLIEAPTYDFSSATNIQGMFKQCSKITIVNDMNTRNIKNFSEVFMDCSSLQFIPTIDTSNATSLYFFLDGCISLRSIPNFVTSKVSNFSRAFSRCEKVIEFPELDTSQATNTSYMLYGNYNLKTINNIDMSNVINASGMFEGCSKITRIPNLDTSKVTNFNSFFRACNELVEAPELNTSKATDISGMYWDCYNLTSIPRINTTNVEKMYETFYGCVKLNEIPELYTEDETMSSPTAKVVDMRGLFNGCKEILEIPEIDTSNVIDLSELVSGCINITSVPTLDVTKARIVNNMFDGCINLERTPNLITTDDTVPCSNATVMYGMFKNCSKLTSIPNISTESAENVVSMFEGCSSIETVPELDLRNAIYAGSMFRNCTSLRTVNNLDFASAEDSLYSLFEGCKSLITAPSIKLSSAIKDLSYLFKNCIKLINIPELDLKNVVNLTEIFRGCSDLIEIPLFTNGTNRVENMNGMFNGCTSLSNIPALETRNVKLMNNMFAHCTALTTIPLLDTRNVESMNYTFNGCTALKTIPQLVTSKVKSFINTFNGCSILSEMPNLDFSSAKDLAGTFKDCKSLLSIPEIDTRNATNMSETFRGCSSLSTIPSSVDTSKATTVYCMLYDCSNITELPTFNLVSITAGSTNASLMISGCEALTRCSFSNNRVDFAVSGFQRLVDVKFYNSPRNANITVTDNPLLDAEAINSMFEALSTVEKATIDISGNGGTNGCDKSIAENKGWTVISNYSTTRKLKNKRR